MAVFTENSTHYYTYAFKILQLAILSIVFSILLSAANAQTVLIEDSVAYLSKKEVSILLAGNPAYDLIKFDKLPGNRIKFGFSGNELCFALLKIKAAKKIPFQLLSIDNTSLDCLVVYRIQFAKPIIKLYEGGRLIRYDHKREFVWHVIPMDIDSTPAYYLIAVKGAEKIINFRYTVTSYPELRNNYEIYDRIVFFYIGIAFMILAIIILGIFLFKKQVFAVYASYIIFISFWIIDHYGFIYPYLFPDMPDLNQVTKPLSSLGAAFMLLTTEKFIFYKNLQYHPVLFKVVEYLRTCLIFLLFFTTLLFIPTLSSSVKILFVILWHSGIIFSVFLIAILPFIFIKRNHIAKIFSCAMLVICLSTLSQLLATTGWINNTFLHEHGMAMGSVIENSIMAFGLLYGLLIERRNKNLQVLALQQEQKEMLERLIYIQASERKRIAADLHDNIGPLLAALKINFRRIINMNTENTRLELIQKTENIIDDSILEIRNVAHNLMPKNLETNGLINTLEDYFMNVQQLYGKQLLFTHEVYSIFKPEMQVNIYFIISELVLNAAKHSTGQVINVSVKTALREVSIRVIDNGQGFQARKLLRKNSFGLHSAESRTNYLNGKFSLKSSAEKGTAIYINIPL